MTIPNLHDRRALEAIVEGMDADAIAQCRPGPAPNPSQPRIGNPPAFDNR